MYKSKIRKEVIDIQVAMVEGTGREKGKGDRKRVR